MKQVFITPIPFWGVLVLLFVMGAGTLALGTFFRQTIFNYALSLPMVEEQKSQSLSYGEEPALSNPDFFKKVKDGFISQKVNFIEADLSLMKLSVYRDGVLAKEVNILTKGKEGSWWETPAGIYKIASKTKSHFSSFGKVYQPWSMAFQGNFFIHGWPYYPDGTPVASTYSGGCIRLSDEDAESVYNLTDAGMPVLVFESDFAPDSFSYRARTPDISASNYLATDIKNNFVFLKQNSEQAMRFGDFSQLLGSLVATDYINIEKSIILDEDMLLGINEPQLVAGESITPFDLLYLGLAGTSTAPTSIFKKYMGGKRFVNLMNDKARAVGMGKTSGDTTTPEDLFYLAKYIYNNRNFILKISAGTLKNNTYDKSRFHDIPNMNVFVGDKNFVGGKFVKNEDGTESFLGIFNIEANGEKRPIFIFLENSQSVVSDVPKVIQYIQSYYQ